MKEVLKTFANMPRTSSGKALRPALRAGGNVVKIAAGVNVAAVADRGYATGLLRRAIRVYSLRRLRGMLRVGVMVQRGLTNAKKIVNGQPVRVGLYASVLEYGKKNQPPRSWLRKAARESTNATLQTIIKVIKERLPIAVEDAKRR
jgi:HK97 gp10 family phage protein